MLGWKLANWQVLSVLIPKMQLNWNDARASGRRYAVAERCRPLTYVRGSDFVGWARESEPRT
jgi:hypothetical protein